MTYKKRPLPIGVDDYKDLIDEGYEYVDKTLLIKEFWEDKAKVILITRPRRFGKSMALSMLRYFFEKTESSNAYLFEKSNIWKEESFRNLQGTYPVIYISFKDVKYNTWEKAYAKLKDVLKNEVDRTLTPLVDQLLRSEKNRYDQLMNFTPVLDENQVLINFSGSLQFITQVYARIHKKQTIILIDEYDSPITCAYENRSYDLMTEVIRAIFSSSLKGNEHLQRGFMTGVVRTSKDGILSGLNNISIHTMLDFQFSDKFGFTELEADGLLEKFNYLDKKEELKSWYNGYVVGSKHSFSCRIYNPWSVLGYIKNFCKPEAYWVNTGSTTLLERLISEADERTQNELRLLIGGGCLENKEINQDVILLDLDKKNIEPWSFLLFAGYLTAVNHVFLDKRNYYTLTVPNEEIAGLYKELVVSSINRTFDSSKLKKLMEAVITGNANDVGLLLQEFLVSLCSFHDLPHRDLENSLHMFVLGLLASLSERYVIKSNLESGDGRYDIMMHPKRAGDAAILMEFKKAKDQDLEKLADQALEQIKISKYESALRDYGYKGQVFCYGIACFKKQLLTKMESIFMSCKL